MRPRWLKSVGAGLIVLGLLTTLLVSGSRPRKASAATTSSIVALAEQNVGKGACSTNSLGGQAFYSSCTGNGGQPEFWCSDFVRWVWAMEGVVGTASLNAAAASVFAYGQAHGTLTNLPAVGDAVVFDYRPTGGYLNGPTADHVAIVSAVNANGTIQTISGDWGGQNGSQAVFSRTSQVVVNPAYPSALGSTSNVMGMTISGYIKPVGPSPSTPDPTQLGSYVPGLAGWARFAPSGHVTNAVNYVAGGAQDGKGYLAFNTNGAGGSVYQDVPVTASAGQSFVGTAWLSSQGGTATGALCMWGWGPSPARGNCRGYSVPAGTYTQAQVDYDPMGPVNNLRFQVYPHTGTTKLDTASVAPSVLQTGSFENGTAGWVRLAPAGAVTNMVRYVGAGAQDGSAYLAFNSNAPGGSVYELAPVSAVAGQAYAGTAWLSSQGGTATGLLCLWGLGTASTNNCRRYSVPAGVYTPVHLVYDVPGPVTWLRFQVYPDAGTTTMDTASVAPSVLHAGSLESSAAGWARWAPAGAQTNMVRYVGAAADDGTGYLAFNTTASGGSVYQDVPVSAEASESFVGTAWLSGQAGTATGSLCMAAPGSSPANANCRAYSVPAGRYVPVQMVFDVRGWVSTLRFQVYPASGTTDLDTASIAPSVLQTGSFEP